MKIAIAADHGGYPLNETVIEMLRAAGHDIEDFGTHDGTQPDDYFLEAVGPFVALGAHVAWPHQLVDGVEIALVEALEESADARLVRVSRLIGHESAPVRRMGARQPAQRGEREPGEVAKSSACHEEQTKGSHQFATVMIGDVYAHWP